jgi:hypothetical protein
MLDKTLFHIRKQEKIIFQLQKQEIKKQKIVYLDDSRDDSLHKIYFIESEHIKEKYYKVIATAFGSTSCSCDDQTKNPYQNCIHMKRLDQNLKDTPNDIQILNQIPRFILDKF